MSYIREVLVRYPKESQRVLEMLPGFVSWNLILFPVWGSFLAPAAVAWFFVLFNGVWLIKSISLTVRAALAHFRIKEWQTTDFMGLVDDFKSAELVHHVVIIPTYKEPLHTLERLLVSLARQTFPAGRIIPVLTFEERAGAADNAAKRAALSARFKAVFAELVFTEHPGNLPGEVVGKSSNMAWAGRAFDELRRGRPDWDENWLTVTSADADVVFDPNYFAALAVSFLGSTARHRRIWQGAMMFYNNLHRIHLLMRVFNRLITLAAMGSLMYGRRQMTFSTYSLSWRLLKEIGFWDVDVIPEDYRLFFKAYFETRGETRVEPIFLPIMADAAESIGFRRTFVNTYEQAKRWAWGASDDAYIIRRALLDRRIAWPDKLLRVGNVVKEHFLWPVWWFTLTSGSFLPGLVNRQFGSTLLGWQLAQVSSVIFTPAFIGFIVLIAVDLRSRPEGDEQPLWRSLLAYLEMFFLLPVSSFLFLALPGLDAHTRLFMGKRIEYRVTEKV